MTKKLKIIYIQQAEWKPLLINASAPLVLLFLIFATIKMIFPVSFFRVTAIRVAFLGNKNNVSGRRQCFVDDSCIYSGNQAYKSVLDVNYHALTLLVYVRGSSVIPSTERIQFSHKNV